MTSVFFNGHHQRQRSANEQLITPTASNSADESNNDSSTQPVYCNPTSTRCVELSLPTRANPAATDMRFSTLSDCSSYYGLPDSPNEAQSRHILKDPYLRSNCGVVLGSLILTLVGGLLIGFGLFLTFMPHDLDFHGFVFLVVGVLFFIPGFYHLFYIVSALCNRPGYSLENLPTFTRNA
ncbi:hypothetical protein M3Y97_00373400 [Aphelenchoides bicaudatus]|nr:hypothetical protein M3Y97_00373400 [Aphelenchoides bicaudatus]